ncbi:MAG: hypothetical protein JWO41_372 [Candidatus Saccharibacteria bacterium]|nr:hypothetical protein [Candidatus Saccharibacteria bacterium]
MDDYQEYAPKSHKKQGAFPILLITLPLFILALCGLSFYGGTAFQKSRDKPLMTVSSGVTTFGTGSGPKFGARIGGEIGSVTAVDATSISVQSQRTGTTKTYTIDSSTKALNAGATANVSDIKVGDSVFVETSGTDTTIATTIVINPGFSSSGGGVMMQSNDSTSGTTQVSQ